MEIRENFAKIIHSGYEKEVEESNTCLKCVEAGDKADQILSHLCAEIKGMGLNDGEIERTIKSDKRRIVNWPVTITPRDKIISQATISKVINNLRGEK